MKKTLAVILSSMFLLAVIAGDSFAVRSSRGNKPRTVKVKSRNHKTVTKDEIKDEVKDEIVEAKDETKDEVKDEIKDEVKDEIKD
ncbi:MAG: hypothetical protein LE169_05825 [Endomicrobium sp.]|nr:hypothetical protein [Endomicrobium sp.]